MSLVWSAAVLIFFVVVRARGQPRHSCYVCVAEGSAQEVSQLFPNDTLVPCRQTSHVKLCPEDYKGCLTESKGLEVTRTCTRLAVEGCRSANGVEYCYCRGELCNVPPLQANVDDEDMTEGSGLTEPTTVKATPPPGPSLNNTRVSSNATLSFRSTAHFFLSLLVLSVWR